MSKNQLNINKPYTSVTNFNTQYISYNFPQIYDGLTMYQSYDYIGINAPLIAKDDTNQNINGQLSFYVPDYSVDAPNTQIAIGDINPHNNNPMIRIAFRVALPAPTPSNPTVEFRIIIDDVDITSYTQEVADGETYIWDIGAGEKQNLFPESLLSLLVITDDQSGGFGAGIEIYPFSITTFYQILKS